MDVIFDLLTLMWRRRRFWILPVALALLLLNALIAGSGAISIAPFIYAIF
jgi:uncharacterized protein involved in exopolysaccharide biosynthesis